MISTERRRGKVLGTRGRSDGEAFRGFGVRYGEDFFVVKKSTVLRLNLEAHHDLPPREESLWRIEFMILEERFEVMLAGT